MTRLPRLRWTSAALLVGAATLALSACNYSAYPNSTFNHHTEFNTAIDALWDRLLFLGTAVFIIVEALLLYVVVKYRRRPGQTAEPRHVHGNTTLEILWTAIPAVILIFIAVPTVRTIFRTQAKAVPSALQVEVIGHQWWWEFRYPQYNVTTANELYIPTGRTVNFALRTADVLHSFWIPQLGGKRDLISNHTNYLWFTPDSAMVTAAWNGFCAEYCGASHANMHFRVYTVQPTEFESWAAGQQQVAAFGAVAPATPAAAQTSGPTTQGAEAAAAANASQARATSAGPKGEAGVPALGSDASSRNTRAQPIGPNSQLTATTRDTVGSTGPAAIGGTTAAAAGIAPGYTYPRDRLPDYIVPHTPVPTNLAFNDALKGDPERGRQIYSGQSCIACHYINGNPVSIAKVGPNLTHVGTRNTIAGGLFPNDTYHLSRWIKNSRAMKPGVVMPTLGKNEYDPITKSRVAAGGLTDQQVADIVAYLQALK